MKYKVVVAQFTLASGEHRAFGGHYADPKDETKTLCGFPVIEKKSAHQNVSCSPCFVAAGGKVRPSKYAPPGAT